MLNKVKRNISFKATGIVLVLLFNPGFVQSCSVCRGNISDSEIAAYTISIILLISIICVFIYIIYKKIKNNYGIS